MLMGFWEVFLIVTVLAAGFVVWPTIFLSKKYKQELRSNARTETNSQVYQDHYRELETLVRGEINQDELDGLKKDLEKTLIEENNMVTDSERPIISSFKSRIPVLTLVFALPILLALLYSYLGAKKDWEIYQMAQERRGLVSQPDEFKIKSTKLIIALQDRLKQKPKNLQNWFLLAHTAVEQGMYDEGVRAYREILKQQPDAPVVKAELAQTLYLRAGNRITPEVRQYTEEALAVAPNLTNALGLAALDAYYSGNYQSAIDNWQRILVQLDPKSTEYQYLSGSIQKAKSALVKTGETVKTPAESNLSLSVKVSLDKQVSVSDQSTVFVYARAWQGPKMPLAIKKMKVSELPAEIKLDQSMSMTQGMDLSLFPQVEVVARISSSGSAIAQPGDWQASVGPVIVANQKESISLKISEKIAQN